MSIVGNKLLKKDAKGAADAAAKPQKAPKAPKPPKGMKGVKGEKKKFFKKKVDFITETIKRERRELREAKRDYSIKAQIQRFVTLVLAVSLIVVGGLGCLASNYSTEQALEISMQEIATESAAQINFRLQSMLSAVEVIGTIAVLSDQTVKTAEKQQMLDHYAAYFGWSSAYITDDTGRVYTLNRNISDRDYYKTAIAGTPCFSEPLVSREDSSSVGVIAAPLWKNGNIGTTPVGIVLVTVPASIISDVAAEIHVSEHGGAYIINQQDIEIADADYERVVAQYSVSKEYQLDPSLKALNDMHQKLIAGETGFGKYTFQGETKYGAYAPIGINGWGLMVTAPTGDFNGTTIVVMIMLLIILAITLAISIVLSRRMGMRIGVAVRLCSDRLALLAKGDLDSPIPEIDTKDETKILIDATTSIVGEQRAIIGDVGYQLFEMAKGNFGVKTKLGEGSYPGAYKELLASVQRMNKNLGETLIEINDSANQIDSGSDQVSHGAQSLSQGATEQASAVEQLAATISDMSGKVNANARHADEANSMMTEANRGVHKSSEHMNDLMASMQDIQKTSDEIGKIIKTIDDIAFQTNILALNAAVEAARAGTAGKGFAVVADEVRNLAGKSAEAASNTTSLIENSIAAVSLGMEHAKETAEALEILVEKTVSVAERMQEIAQASEEQAQAVNQISVGIDQITAVTQTTSATSEEAAAASEELSSQASLLRDLVHRFQFDSE